MESATLRQLDDSFCLTDEFCRINDLCAKYLSFYLLHEVPYLIQSILCSIYLLEDFFFFFYLFRNHMDILIWFIWNNGNAWIND